MSLIDFDAALAYSFSAEVGGIQIKHITEVTGLKLEIDMVELKMNNEQGQYIIRKMPGRVKAGEITLTRHYFAHDGFSEWMSVVGLGDVGVGRKSGHVSLLDTQGNTLKRWQFLNGIAKALELSTLKAGSTDAVTEKLTIAHEGLEIVS